MDGKYLNTLFVQSRGAVLRRDHRTISVVLEKKTLLSVPIHQIQAVVIWGGIHVTPSCMALCAVNDVAVNFLAPSGRFLARVVAPGHGSVLLRRAQFRSADSAALTLPLVKSFVAGKIKNTRSLLVRSARETIDPAVTLALQAGADRLEDSLRQIPLMESADSVRGHEGAAAMVYFSLFNHLIRNTDPFFQMRGRTRRPPLDAVNCLLSFLYGLLLQDSCAAIASFGMDPSVGFLHVDHPGRPSLALDLMEEFRPILADRLAIAMINRQQIQQQHFDSQETGAVLLSEAGRKIVLAAWQQRKKEEVTHILLKRKVPLGLVFSIQARILAKVIRGELPQYLPYTPRN